MGYPARNCSHIGFQICPAEDNPGVDPIVLVVVLAVGMPLAVIAALAISARLRGGPQPQRESRRRVDSLVTQAIPEEHADGDDPDDQGPTFTIHSPPPEPDPELRGRAER